MTVPKAGYMFRHGPFCKKNTFIRANDWGTRVMVLFNYSTKELTAKIVYYGPGLCGKTTNLQSLHAAAQGESAGRLMTLDTKDDRTLFFDLLPLTFEDASGLSVRVKLFTVPGQVIHASTRRLVVCTASESPSCSGRDSPSPSATTRCRSTP